MLYPVTRYLTISSLVLFLSALAACSTGIEDVKNEFSNYKFDQQVINKLPVYDSLAAVIVESYPLFRKDIRDEDSYRSFRYMPSSDDPEAQKKLPAEAALKIDPYFARLGKDLIYGFDLFKDSSIKIYVKKSFSKKSRVDIVENLSYYPSGDPRRRDFPEKDSTLNRNWQYWTRFDRRGLF